MHVNVKSQKSKKGESLKRPQLQRTMPLYTQNWTRWLVRLGEPFRARVLFKDRSKTRHLHVNVKTQKNSKKLKKRRSTESPPAPPHNIFSHSKLDTVGSSARRTFFCEGFAQGRSKTRHLKPSAHPLTLAAAEI